MIRFITNTISTIALTLFIFIVIPLHPANAQSDCLKSNKELAKYKNSTTKQVSRLEKAIKYCPKNIEAKLLLGTKLITSHFKKTQKEGAQLLYDYLDSGGTNVDAQLNLAIYTMLSSDFEKSYNQINSAKEILKKSKTSDSLRINITYFELYLDTLKYLGEDIIYQLIKEKSAEDFLQNNYFLHALNDGLAPNSKKYLSTLPQDEYKSILMYRIGLDDSKLNYNPYYFFDNAELLRKKYESYYSKHKYASNSTGYTGVKNNYEDVIRLLPEHIPTLDQLAAIAYFSRDYRASYKYYRRIHNALNSKEKVGPKGVQTLRMIRRNEWLLSTGYNGNTIKENVLYYDKGRLDKTLLQMGSLMADFGEIGSIATGNISYAQVGSGLNVASALIHDSRLSVDWYWKAKKEKDWNTIYKKSEAQFSRHINNSGFYSEQTILMLIGMSVDGIKSGVEFESLVNNYRALVDMVYLSNIKKNYYVTSAIVAGKKLLDVDDKLYPIERFKLVQTILELENIYQEQNDGENYLDKGDLYILNERKKSAKTDILKNIK